MRRALVPLLVLGLLGGCAGAPPRPPATARSVPATLGERAAQLAVRYLGTPYRYGGASAEGFDCSGLVWFVYRALGVHLPRRAADQRALLPAVPRAQLEPGDLVFFSTPDDHVGIYLGDGEFVHAAANGARVARTRLDAPYFILGFAGAARVPQPAP